MTSYYIRNRAKVIKNVTERRSRLVKELRSLVGSIKMSNPCCICGGWFHWCAMDFDHVAGDKVSNVAQAVGMGRAKMVMSELLKCQLVCSNCHRLETYTREY